MFPAQQIARLMKRIEHLFHITFINTGSGIGDRHDVAVVVAAPERQREQPVSGVLSRLIDQI